MIVMPRGSNPPIIIPTPVPVPHTNTHTETGTEYIPLSEPTAKEKVFCITALVICLALFVYLLCKIMRI